MDYNEAGEGAQARTRIDIDFSDLRSPQARANFLFRTAHGMRFLQAVSAGRIDCLLCGKRLGVAGAHEVLVHGFYPVEGQSVNVGVCAECFKKNGSFDKTMWAAGDFMRTTLLVSTN